MCRVDRSILRIAAYEIGFRQDIPANVAINEAIEIAKRYGSTETPMFINGVVDRIASTVSEAPKLEVIRQPLPKESAVVDEPILDSELVEDLALAK